MNLSHYTHNNLNTLAPFAQILPPSHVTNSSTCIHLTEARTHERARAGGRAPVEYCSAAKRLTRDAVMSANNRSLYQQLGYSFNLFPPSGLSQKCVFRTLHCQKNRSTLSFCPIRCKASVLMQSLAYPIETVSSNKITRNRIVLSF